MGPQLGSLIKAVIEKSPKQQVVGRKRLQKQIHLLAVSGERVPAQFRIHHYGPFSSEISDAIEALIKSGEVGEKEEPTGVYFSTQIVYENVEHQVSDFEPSKNFVRVLDLLNKFSTMELEIASTIAHFKDSGSNHDQAIKAVVEMKPSKAVAPVVARASSLLDELRRI